MGAGFSTSAARAVSGPDPGAARVFRHRHRLARHAHPPASISSRGPGSGVACIGRLVRLHPVRRCAGASARTERLLRACRNGCARRALIASLPNSGHAYFRGHVLMGDFLSMIAGCSIARTCGFAHGTAGWICWPAPGSSSRSYTVRVCRLAGVAEVEDSLWVRALERLSYESAQAWKSLFAYQFIVRARAERLT